MGVSKRSLSHIFIAHIFNAIKRLDKNPEVKNKQQETPLELIYILALQDAYPCHADSSI
ncbi:hypothetical protein [Proteus faecis]|uniref:hypothetical protein n=1 Tax=Proteus faecis TaxID=2050967 RepID=UPI0020BE3C76|nr:hypothetical protein [Proteus faecis]MCT8250923.1 hypothetical protein [Proteus faecis]